MIDNLSKLLFNFVPFGEYIVNRVSVFSLKRSNVPEPFFDLVEPAGIGVKLGGVVPESKRRFFDLQYGAVE